MGHSPRGLSAQAHGGDAEGADKGDWEVGRLGSIPAIPTATPTGSYRPPPMAPSAGDLQEEDGPPAA